MVLSHGILAGKWSLAKCNSKYYIQQEQQIDKIQYKNESMVLFPQRMPLNSSTY